jgi:glutathione peroxidase
MRPTDRSVMPALASPIADQRRRLIVGGAGSALAAGLAIPRQLLAQPTGASSCPALLRHSLPRLQDDQPVALCDFAGKVLLVVNTASYCGFTPQYEGLERLHGRLSSRGLVILGFPSNDFGQQEPGNSTQIGAVCFNTYGVRFPMFAKIRVAGPDAHPLYAELTRATGEPPRWNFHKYLIDRSGRPLASYPSRVAPDAAPLVRAIEKALAERV